MRDYLKHHTPPLPPPFPSPLCVPLAHPRSLRPFPFLPLPLEWAKISLLLWGEAPFGIKAWARDWVDLSTQLLNPKKSTSSILLDSLASLPPVACLLRCYATRIPALPLPSPRLFTPLSSCFFPFYSPPPSFALLSLLGWSFSYSLWEICDLWKWFP